MLGEATRHEAFNPRPIAAARSLEHLIGEFMDWSTGPGGLVHWVQLCVFFPCRALHAIDRNCGASQEEDCVLAMALTGTGLQACSKGCRGMHVCPRGEAQHSNGALYCMGGTCVYQRRPRGAPLDAGLLGSLFQ